jgi:hypothetical protein
MLDFAKLPEDPDAVSDETKKMFTEHTGNDMFTNIVTDQFATDRDRFHALASLYGIPNGQEQPTRFTDEGRENSHMDIRIDDWVRGLCRAAYQQENREARQQ